MTMNLERKLIEFSQLSDSQKRELENISEMYQWLMEYREQNPADIVAAQKSFLFVFYFGNDPESALEIAMTLYDQTDNPDAVILIASIEHEYRGGIDYSLYEHLLTAGRKNHRRIEVYLFYQAMYLKKVGRDFESLLKEAISINDSFSNAYLELSLLHNGNIALHNGYLEKAISRMTIIHNPQTSELFSIDYYFGERVFRTRVSEVEFEYYKSLRK